MFFCAAFGQQKTAERVRRNIKKALDKLSYRVYNANRKGKAVCG